MTTAITATATSIAPRRGTWIAVTLADGQILTCRFAWAGISRLDDRRRWCVDHGAYGRHRNDIYIAEDSIVAVATVTRPPLLLSCVVPPGRRVFVGRYATHSEAESAIAPLSSFASEIEVEAKP